MTDQEIIDNLPYIHECENNELFFKEQISYYEARLKENRELLETLKSAKFVYKNIPFKVHELSRDSYSFSRASHDLNEKSADIYLNQHNRRTYCIRIKDNTCDTDVFLGKDFTKERAEFLAKEFIIRNITTAKEFKYDLERDKI